MWIQAERLSLAVSVVVRTSKTPTPHHHHHPTVTVKVMYLARASHIFITAHPPARFQPQFQSTNSVVADHLSMQDLSLKAERARRGASDSAPERVQVAPHFVAAERSTNLRPETLPEFASGQRERELQEHGERGGAGASPFLAEVGGLFKRTLEEANAHPSITEFLNDEVPLLFDSPVLRKSPLFFPASQNKEKRDVADIPRRLITYSLGGDESVEAKTGGAGLSLGERFLPRESIAKLGLLFDVCETVLRQSLAELETSLGLDAGVLTSLCGKGAMHAIRLLR